MPAPVEQTLQELEHFDARGERVLSLYLATDPSAATGRDLHAQLADLAHELQSGREHGEAWTERLRRQFQLAGKALDDIHTPPRSLALFVCAERDFVRAVPLMVRLAPGAFWGPAPYLRPLDEALDEFERVLVVLIDKEESRLFRVFMGEIEAIGRLEEPTPGHHRQFGGTPGRHREGGAPGYSAAPDMLRGGWADSGIARHEAMHVHHHAKRTVAAVLRVIEEQRIDRVLIGGTPEASTEFRRLLPKSMRARVAPTTLHISLFATPAEVLAATNAAIAQLERDEEQRLVDEVVELIGTGRAVAGLTAVADAAYADNVHQLIYGEGAAMPGGYCQDCARLLAPPAPAVCPVCAGAVRPVLDFIAHLAAAVSEAGGHAEEVRGAAAERLAALGGAAAILRYAVAGTATAPAEPAHVGGPEA